MIKEANNLKKKDLLTMANGELANEINERIEKFSYWVNTYWEYFIPFAHGARLFGQVYNDTLVPEDPFEFIELLKTDEMESIKRNRMMGDLAGMIRDDPDLELRLRSGTNKDKHSPFHKKLHLFMASYGSVFLESESDILALLLEMARKTPSTDFQNRKNVNEVKELERAFLNSFTGNEIKFADELLDLARASYRLRDDDNIYLGRIEKRMTEAIDRGRSRIASRFKSIPDDAEKEEIVKALLDARFVPQKKETSKNRKSECLVRTRQLRGQPASQGIVSGKARVV